MCAERTLLFYAGAAHPDAIVEKLLIVAKPSESGFLKESIKPCGGCRQVIAETVRRQGNKSIEIILFGETTTLVMNEKALLPFAFGDF